MQISIAQQVEALSAHLEGLERAADALPEHPEAGTSVRRIARSLEAAAATAGLMEIEAGAVAIQSAADVDLARSVTDFLVRVEELRYDGPAEEVTVLIVEDNRTVSTATEAYLKAAGRELIVAESALEASSILDSRKIDVVILDLILPDRDGRDVLVSMREKASTSIIPVIVLSSTENPVVRAECLAVGADEFIVKPADPKSLRSAIVRQIRSGRIRRDAVRDGLTGLANRAGLTAYFNEQRRETTAAKRPLSVAVVTLDSLAEVTMKMGRDAGDRFVLEACAALHQAIGARDRLGRWEKEKLAAVLPDSSAEDCISLLNGTIGELLTDSTLEEFSVAGIEVEFSAGATIVDDKQDLRDAISVAERSIYDKRSVDEPGEGDLLVYAPRVLLVEDDQVTATLLHHRLVRDGHEVVAFPDGSEALDWAERETFDIAVLDVKVPGMDGFELLARLRAIPRFADVPIIMLSGMGSEADVIRGLELGADDYMLKPFSPTELLARVRRLLNARGSKEGAASVLSPQQHSIKEDMRSDVDDGPARKAGA